MWQKFEFYIISLFFLFVLIFISKVPYNFEEGYKILGINELFTNHKLILVCLFFMILGGIFFFKFKFNFEKGSALLPAKIEEIENINFESVTFLATYIVPLACIDLDKERSSLILLVILCLIGWIYIKTNLFYTNPTLAIWGYHIYRVSTHSKKNITIITKRKIQIGDDIFLKKIDEKIYIAKQNL